MNCKSFIVACFMVIALAQAAQSDSNNKTDSNTPSQRSVKKTTDTADSAPTNSPAKFDFYKLAVKNLASMEMALNEFENCDPKDFDSLEAQYKDRKNPKYIFQLAAMLEANRFFDNGKNSDPRYFLDKIIKDLKLRIGNYKENIEKMENLSKKPIPFDNFTFGMTPTPTEPEAPIVPIAEPMNTEDGNNELVKDDNRLDVIPTNQSASNNNQQNVNPNNEVTLESGSPSNQQNTSEVQNQNILIPVLEPKTNENLFLIDKINVNHRNAKIVPQKPAAKQTGSLTSNQILLIVGAALLVWAVIASSIYFLLRKKPTKQAKVKDNDKDIQIIKEKS